MARTPFIAKEMSCSNASVYHRSILDRWVRFYSSLFTAEEVDLSVQQDLLLHVSAHLSSEQASLCEGYLSVEEVFAALNGMAKGKAPGSDGFPMEFYITIWEILGQDLVEVLNSSLDLGNLPFSQRGALISLIF